MLSVSGRLLLKSTALAPVGLTYAWVAYFRHEYMAAAILCGISALPFIACLLVMRQAKREFGVSAFKVTSIKPADHENTVFLLLFIIIPLFVSQFNTPQWQFLVPTLVILGIIAVNWHNYHFNPILGLLGWRIYKVVSQEGVNFILITKNRLNTTALEFKVVQLTEYFLLDLEEK